MIAAQRRTWARRPDEGSFRLNTASRQRPRDAHTPTNFATRAGAATRSQTSQSMGRGGRQVNASARTCSTRPVSRRARSRGPLSTAVTTTPPGGEAPRPPPGGSPQVRGPHAGAQAHPAFSFGQEGEERLFELEHRPAGRPRGKARAGNAHGPGRRAAGFGGAHKGLGGAWKEDVEPGSGRARAQEALFHESRLEAFGKPAADGPQASSLVRVGRLRKQARKPAELQPLGHPPRRVGQNGDRLCGDGQRHALLRCEGLTGKDEIEGRNARQGRGIRQLTGLQNRVAVRPDDAHLGSARPGDFRGLSGRFPLKAGAAQDDQPPHRPLLPRRRPIVAACRRAVQAAPRRRPAPRRRDAPAEAGAPWMPWSGRRDSNSRPSAWEADTLPTELRPPKWRLL